MTKTIDEAANEYAANWEAKHNIHNPELYDLIVDVYKASAEHMMSLPLSSRLTADEKERVRTYHKLARDGYWECNCADKAVVKVLESIFGADFFKEGGDD